MRTVLLVCAIAGFAGLGLLDLIRGEYRTGIAGTCLALANALLLTR